MADAVRNWIDHLGLPLADIPLEGVDSRLLQLDGSQVLLMSFSKDVELPEHSHAVQSGMVLSGRIDLMVAGVTRNYQRGDVYTIPAGLPHSARICAGYSDVTYFDAPDRYQPS